MQNSETAAPVRSNPYLWMVIIAITCLLSFSGAVRSDYYMDDFMFVVDAKGEAPPDRYYTLPIAGALSEPGRPGSKEVTLFEIIPTAFWLMTDRLVSNPTDGSWAYHLWNLIFHILTSCAAYLAAREGLKAMDVFDDAVLCDRAALLGALLFACHPLCSEPVNYAKCLNHVVEAFFGLLAFWQGCIWLRKGTSRSAKWCVALLFLTAFSYFPGLAITVLWLAGVAAFRFFRKATPRRKLSRGVKLSLSVLFVLACILYGITLVGQQANWGTARLAHIMTQGRVFWYYLSECFLPANLCSDHHIPWSVPGEDTGAVFSLGAVILLVILLVVGCFRLRQPLARGLSVISLLGLAPLLLRFLYINSEVIVEYRTYSALPWLMLVPACALTSLFQKKRRYALYAAVPAIFAFVFLSANRTQQWNNRETLLTDVMEQYPLHHRARTQLQALYAQNGDHAGVIRLHNEIRAVAAKLAALNAKTKSRQYETKELPMAFIHSSQWMIYAIADADGSQASLKWAEKVIPVLQQNFPSHFIGDLSLKDPGSMPNAWPALMARNTVRENAAAIDAARRSRLPQSTTGVK